MARTRGQVVQRDSGRWYAIVSVTDATGKRKRPRRGPFATRAEAQAALDALLGEVGSGSYVIPSAQPVAAFLRSWLDGRRHDIRPTTVSGYAGSIDRYIEPAIGKVPLASLGPQQVRAMYAAMGDRGLSPQTIRHAHVLLHRAFSDAVSDGLLARSPLASVRPPRVTSQEQSTWSPADLARFLAYARDHASQEVATAIHLAATSGMRRSEVLGLQWSAVDFDAGLLRVTRTRVTIGGRTIVGEPKTARSRRTVHLDAGTVAVLREWRLAQAPGAVDCFGIAPNSLTKRFVALVRASGLPRVRFHDLRHTAASMLLATGTSIATVSARLGHAQAAITLSIYSHALPGSDAEAADRLASLIAAGAEPGAEPPIHRPMSAGSRKVKPQVRGGDGAI